MAKNNFTPRETLSEKAFMSETRKHNVVSAAEAADLALKAQGGDLKAEDKLFKANMRLVITIAKLYLGCGLAFEDLLQFGSEGLLAAIFCYDPSRGGFCNHAGLLIKAKILESIQKYGRRVRIPKGVEALQRKVRRVSDVYLATYGVQPSVDTIAEMLGVTEREVKNALLSDFFYVEGDAPVGDDEGKAKDTQFDLIALPDSEVNTEQEDLKQEMRVILSTLTERERKVVIMRHGLDGEEMTLRDIGLTLGISIEGVRQIDLRAQNKIRLLACA